MGHSIPKNSNGGNVLVKLDISKTYDRVDWNFLLNVLANFGFSSHVCDLIKEFISTPSYFININGTSIGFFKGDCNLRQEEPLSPYLFIIMQEMLSLILKHFFETGKIGHFTHTRNTPLISHLMYVDDIVIFANGGMRAVRSLMKVFNLYETWMDQVLNKNKSVIYIFFF